MDSTLTMLCAFAVEAQHRPLNAEQRAKLIWHLVDTIGCGAAASTTEPLRQACSSVLKLDGSGPCTVFPNARAAVDRATFLNGFMQRHLDYNDSYLGKASVCHPSDVIAAALAVGEAEHRSGDETLRAIAAGYNVVCSLCDLVNVGARGWDLSLGAVAVAVDVGMLLRLDSVRMAHAISLSIVPQIPLYQTRVEPLSVWKGAAFANAAAHAVFATYLAADGMTGPEAPFEGRFGVFAQVSGPLAFALDAGRDCSRHTDIKLAPTAFHAQGPIQLAIELRPRLGDFAPGDATEVLHAVDEVEMWTYKRALSCADTPEKWAPKTHATADHSIPFLFAVALGYGRLKADDIDRGLHDAAVLELTRRVCAVREDPALSARFPPEAPVRARLRGPRQTLEHGLSAPLGNHTRPMPAERILEKFHENADPAVGPQRAATHLNRLLEFATLQDVAGILEA